MTGFDQLGVSVFAAGGGGRGYANAVDHRLGFFFDQLCGAENHQLSPDPTVPTVVALLLLPVGNKNLARLAISTRHTRRRRVVSWKRQTQDLFKFPLLTIA